MSPFRLPCLEVRNTPDRGRGVFTTTKIRFGTVLERAPVLLMPADEVLDTSPTLRRYVFDWRETAGDDVVGIALGFGSLYNHDWPANAAWRTVAPDLLEIIAHRDIQADCEITINYCGEPDDPEPPDFVRSQ